MNWHHQTLSDQKLLQTTNKNPIKASLGGNSKETFRTGNSSPLSHNFFLQAFLNVTHVHGKNEGLLTLSHSIVSIFFSFPCRLQTTCQDNCKRKDVYCQVFDVVILCFGIPIYRMKPLWHMWKHSGIFLNNNKEPFLTFIFFATFWWWNLTDNEKITLKMSLGISS